VLGSAIRSILKGAREQGSDWTNVYIRSTDSPHDPQQPKGRDDGRLEDVIRFVKFSSLSWTKDEKGMHFSFVWAGPHFSRSKCLQIGFFYQRYPEHRDHGEHDDDKAGTGTGRDINAMVRPDLSDKINICKEL
jgi:prolyl oligopeptidase